LGEQPFDADQMGIVLHQIDLWQSVTGTRVVSEWPAIRIRRLLMAQSTGIILAVGTISFGNQLLINHELDFKIPVATAVAAIILSGVEKVSAPLAVGIAYIALVTISLTRVNGKASPAENLINYTGIGK
jgi:hypothetical protein